MNYTKLTWIEVTIPLEGGVTQWPAAKEGLNTLLSQMQPRRHPSSLWQKTSNLTRGTITIWRYHVIIAGLKERDEMILKDLGYDMKPITATKAIRKAKYKRIERNDYRTK